jgi:ankyrin repeat protein
MLLDAGADIETVGRAWDGGDGTALWAAAQNAHEETAKLLVERGADVNSTDVGGSTSVLILAAGNDLPELVELLLQKGADINHQNENGATALHGAAFHPFRGISSPESARVLIEHGAALDIEDAQGRTPLDIALPDVAEILREAGAAE